MQLSIRKERTIINLTVLTHHYADMVITASSLDINHLVGNIYDILTLKTKLFLVSFIVDAVLYKEAMINVIKVH